MCLLEIIEGLFIAYLSHITHNLFDFEITKFFFLEIHGKWQRYSYSNQRKQYVKTII